MTYQGDSDCEIEYAEIGWKKSPKFKRYRPCHRIMLQNDSSQSKLDRACSASYTEQYRVQSRSENKHHEKVIRSDHGSCATNSASASSFVSSDPLPNTRWNFSPKLLKRLTILSKEHQSLEDTPTHKLYSGAKTLVHHAYRILTFYEIEIELPPNCSSTMSKAQVCVGLFYRSWKNFLTLFEQTKVYKFESHFISVIVSFVKVAVLLIIDTHLTEAILNTLISNPTGTSSLETLLEFLDTLLLDFLGQNAERIQNILQQETSDVAVEKLMETLHVRSAADAFGPVITTTDGDDVDCLSLSCQSKKARLPQWGFLEFHVLKRERISTFASQITALNKSNIAILTPDAFDKLNLFFPHESKEIFPSRNAVHFYLSETPHRLYLQELMTVDLRYSTKTLPLHQKKSVSWCTAYVTYPSRNFLPCQINIEQHARMTLETGEESFSIAPGSWIILTGRSSSGNSHDGTLRKRVRSTEFILIHAVLHLDSSFSRQVFPSIFSSSFRSVIQLSYSLKPKKYYYHLFLLRCRRHVYTLKSNAIKAGKSVYGRSALQKIYSILQQLQNMLQLLNVAHLLGEFFFRVCAFQEVFWCSSLPFHPLMPGDILGYTWNEEDVHTLKFRDTLERLLEYLTEGASDGILDITIPSYQRSKMIFFLAESLARPAHCCSSSLPLQWYVNPVWKFDNVEVKTFPFDEPRKRLRGQLGVFATKKIKENEIIGPYVGRVYHDGSETSVKSTTRYLTTYIASREQYEMSIKTNLVIDSCSSGNRMNFVNDYRLVPEACFFNSEKRINCFIKSIFSMADGPEIPVFCAARDIYPGEEILVDYGKDYWAPENPATTRPYFYGAQDVRKFLEQTEMTWKAVENRIKSSGFADNCVP